MVGQDNRCSVARAALWEDLMTIKLFAWRAAWRRCFSHLLQHRRLQMTMAANHSRPNMQCPATWQRKPFCSMRRAPVRAWSRSASLVMCCSPMIMAKAGGRRPQCRRAIRWSVSPLCDNQTGYAVGHAATILKTVDGGDNWTLQYVERNGETPLLRCILPTPKTALLWAVFLTHLKPKMAAKAGPSAPWWKTAMTTFISMMYSPTRKGNIYIPAEFGTVYKSRDRGQNWQAIETGYDGSFWGGLALSNGDVLVFGMRGNVWRSSNAGKRWKQVETGTDQSVSGGTQLSDGRVILAGLSGTVLVSQQWRQKLYQSAAPRPLKLCDRHRQSWQ